MTNEPQQTRQTHEAHQSPQVPQARTAIFHMNMSEFWSGDLGLTLMTISLCALVLVINPLREAGIYGRVFFDVLVVTLMISGALVVKQSRVATALVVGFVVASAVVLITGRRSFINSEVFSPRLRCCCMCALFCWSCFAGDR